MLKRQGDILFEHTDDSSHVSGRPVEDGVIALGETTGHAHRVEDAMLLQHIGGTMVINAPTGGTVVHEEHDTIILEPGVWLVHRQVEYVAPGETATVYD